MPDGRVGFRCAAEPVSAYLAKGGTLDETHGRKCICNALIATMGYPQVRGRQLEPPLVTAGDAINALAQFMPPGSTTYTAADVIAHLLGPRASAA
jgi:nitronate monooxygenase